MEELIKMLGPYGFPWVIIAVGIFFIYRMQTIHREERAEWREQYNEQHQDVVVIAKDTNTILSEIKTMISFKK